MWASARCACTLPGPRDSHVRLVSPAGGEGRPQLRQVGKHQEQLGGSVHHYCGRWGRVPSAAPQMEAACRARGRRDLLRDLQSVARWLSSPEPKAAELQAGGLAALSRRARLLFVKSLQPPAASDTHAHHGMSRAEAARPAPSAGGQRAAAGLPALPAAESRRKQQWTQRQPGPAHAVPGARVSAWRPRGRVP